MRSGEYVEYLFARERRSCTKTTYNWFNNFNPDRLLQSITKANTETQSGIKRGYKQIFVTKYGVGNMVELQSEELWNGSKDFVS